LTRQMSAADFFILKSLCPKSLLEPRRKDHFLYLKNPRKRRSASSSVTYAMQLSILMMN
jgi:hypothetical protein